MTLFFWISRPVYKVHIVFLLCRFRFLICFLALQGKSALVQILRERFFCSCLMYHHVFWSILKQQYMLPSLEQFVLWFPPSSFRLTLSVQNTFLMVYLNIWKMPLPTKICLGFFSRCGISKRYLWSFFNVYCLSRPWHWYITTCLPMPRGR